MIRIETLAMLATPFEMLIVNLFVIDRCSTKKYAARTTYAWLGLFIVILFFPSYWLVSLLPNFGNGNGLFIVFGFMFAIPVKILYRNSAVRIIALACTSWIYTYIVFAVSIHISYMVKSISRAYTAFITQTLLYAVSFVWFYKKLKYKLIPMFSQLNPGETKSLMWMGIVWFWTILILNLSFIYADIYLLRVLTICSFGVCAYNFYHHTHLVIQNNRTVESLEHIAYYDDLTQLRSRALLSSDVEHLISRNIRFLLVFMDLDNFKQINDQYGHAVGDEYLAFFAKEIKTRIGSTGGFYRIAGDEFVGILVETDIDKFVEELKLIPNRINGTNVPFLGFSYGVAAFPSDSNSLSDLLETADQRMYQMKNDKKGDPPLR